MLRRLRRKLVGMNNFASFLVVRQNTHHGEIFARFWFPVVAGKAVLDTLAGIPHRAFYRSDFQRIFRLDIAEKGAYG